MIEAIGAIIDSTREVAVSMEECRISATVFNDLNELVHSVLQEGSIESVDTSEITAESTDSYSIEAEVGSIYSQLDARSTYFKGGHSYETDDRGTVYKKDGELIPEVEYVSNGGKYRIDVNGSVETLQEVYLSTYEERLTRTPLNGERGKWTAERGESKYIPDSKTDAGARASKKLSEYGLDGIEYQDAIPDFSKCSEDSVEIDMTEDRFSNFAKAYQEFAKKWNIERKNGKDTWTPREVQLYKFEHRLTIHECHDKKTCRLVSQDIHDYYGHTGGVFECKKSIGQSLGGGFDV